MPDPRPLGPANLVTLDEARAELRLGRDAARDLLARLTPVEAGRHRLYVWGEVLALVRPERPPPPKRQPRGGPRPWTLP